MSDLGQAMLFNQYQKLVELMETSGSPYLKKQSIRLDLYLTQLKQKEISIQNFKVLIQDLIELRYIEKTDDPSNQIKLRHCLNEAKKLLTIT